MPDRAVRTFRLIVRTASGPVVDTAATAVNAEDASGRFGLRPGVEPVVAALVPTLLEYRDADGESHLLAIHRGALGATGDAVDVAARRAIPCAGLDTVREELVQVAREERDHARSARRAFGGMFRQLYAALIEEERRR